MKKEMPYGLVLAGGGAKGVYQIGAWKALRELGIAVDCVVGTSVGAMNGALVALGLYDEAEALWKSMSIERGFQLSAPLRRPDKLFSIQNAGILSASCGSIMAGYHASAQKAGKNWWMNRRCGRLRWSMAW